MEIFDDLFGDEKKKQEQKKGHNFNFSWLTNGGKAPIKPKKHKPAYKDLEAYFCD